MSYKDQSKGRAVGGKARAAKLTPDERRASASKAAQARWKRADGVTRLIDGYSGQLDLGGVKIPCAVAEGPVGIIRVVSESGLATALLGTRSGASKRLKKAAADDGAPLPVFLAPSQLLPFIDNHLRDGPLRPIEVEFNGSLSTVFDASIIPAVCNIWLRAREAGALQVQQLPKAQKAEILMRALAEVGIVALVDEATGFQAARPKDALQQYLEKLVRKELAAWAKKFPDEFYENIYRLRNWPWSGMGKNRYSAVAGYTRDLIYERMAPGLLDELTDKSPQDENGNRSNKLHQWLTDDIGNPMLAAHMQSVLTLQRLAVANGWGWQKFIGMVDQVMPKKGSSLPLPFEAV